MNHLANLMKHLPNSLPLNPPASGSESHFQLDPDDVKSEGMMYAFNRNLEICFETHKLRGGKLLFTEHGQRVLALKSFFKSVVKSQSLPDARGHQLRWVERLTQAAIDSGAKIPKKRTIEVDSEEEGDSARAPPPKKLQKQRSTIDLTREDDADTSSPAPPPHAAAKNTDSVPAAPALKQQTLFQLGCKKMSVEEAAAQRKKHAEEARDKMAAAAEREKQAKLRAAENRKEARRIPNRGGGNLLVEPADDTDVPLERVVKDSLGLDIPHSVLPGTEAFCVAADTVVEGNEGMLHSGGDPENIWAYSDNVLAQGEILSCRFDSTGRISPNAARTGLSPCSSCMPPHTNYALLSSLAAPPITDLQWSLLAAPVHHLRGPHAYDDEHDHRPVRALQWLASDFQVDKNGEVKLKSPYINNASQEHHGALVPRAVLLWEKNSYLQPNGMMMPSRALGAVKLLMMDTEAWVHRRLVAGQLVLPDAPLKYKDTWEDNMVDSVGLANSTIQVIVKIASIVLTPENPKYSGDIWHVEGEAMHFYPIFIR
ncbi:hypothetical protein FB451DRAFT_1184129 [Mycena latifolia]|nr:hypothetical protein FB451DRAFT_1184129 [Mycena latifolia]